MTSQAAAALPYALAPATARRRLAIFYGVEGLTSVGGNLLLTGVFFYTKHRFGWGLMDNFLLAMVQGLVYVLGSLLASRMTRLLGGRRKLLVVLYLGMVLVAATGTAAQSASLVVGLLIVYTLLCSMNWPVLEGLVCSDASAHEMSRRVGIYNLVWAGVGALVIAVNGSIIQYWQIGVFAIPMIAHALSAMLIALSTRNGGNGGNGGQPSNCAAAGDAHAHALPPEEAEALLSKRTLALWLSRIGLPATYTVIYSLMAMMPLLPIMRELSPAQQTLLGSVWLAGRWAAFLVLGATIWWHTRPRMLLVASALMLVAFLGIVLRPGDIIPGLPLTGLSPYLWMIAWQCALGAALGMIYAGSLYFGMVLSEGSTEHGGYHEALIGLGAALGPGLGALAQHIAPQHSSASIIAVAGLVALSVLAAAVATVRLGARAR